METKMEPVNNAAVEISRRRSIVEARQTEKERDAAHRLNVPKQPGNSAVVITDGRFKLAIYERNDWIANAEIQHTLQDILNPAYWAHVASRMHPYDHIEVRAEDGSWLAKLLVVQCDRSWAKVALIDKIDLVPVEAMASVEPLHKVEWKGPQHRFGVIRLADNEMIKSGFQDKDLATAWMREHERVIATQ